MPELQRYADHVRTILDELVDEVRGKLVLEVIDPLSSPDEKERARQHGIEAVQLSQGRQPIYFGLAGSNSAGATASIPFLQWDPKNEALLNHDLVRLIYKLAVPAGASGDGRYATLTGKAPLVIGHRGAASLFPEHTIPSYLQAIKDGADCIEPDLVMTKDGVVVARHDIYLSTTTDVASHPEFVVRKRNGPDPAYANMENWYVSDFTLAEIKTLRAIQPVPGRSHTIVASWFIRGPIATMRPFGERMSRLR